MAARGLVPHTREERRRVIERLVKPICAHFGDNLEALAVQASVARGDDGPYSDLELCAFVREMPPGRRGVGIIHGGLLIELIWTTREAWLDMVARAPGQDWHLAGSDVLQPVVNAEYIAALRAEAGQVSRAAARDLARGHWHDVQESTAKVLKAAAAGESEALSLIYPDMVRHMLISLAFLNARPFTTFARMIDEARGFDMKPIEFESLVGALRSGYGDTGFIHDLALAVFEDLEGLLAMAGVDPYKPDLDLFG